MLNKILEDIAEQLRQSGQYRIINKYYKPEGYNTDSSTDKKLIGVFLDTETTGLSCVTDRIIELGMVKFEYTEDGRIFRLLDEFNRYQDPGMPIPEAITKLTGITDDMVKGHQINVEEVDSYLKDVDIIIAHNAQFDRAFFEIIFLTITPKPWGCSMYDIDWKNEGISSHKLEYIAYKYNFFFEGHRAITDCLAGVHILSQESLISKQPVLKQLLESALAIRFRLWATNAPYESKDLLKMRGYRWSMNQNDKQRAWSIELKEDQIEEEINYLRSEIYGSSINIPIEVFDAYSRFSNHYGNLENGAKYQDKIEMVKMLCLK
jgi:DNA polymerase-3 subunit epsilon